MKQFFRTLFCKHKYRTTRWHWFHGFTSMEPSRIEAELKCRKCGKITYAYPERGSIDEKFFKALKELQQI